MNTINFRELVKKIHPDYNPSMEDAGTKMASAIKYKNDPSYLYRLAVSWGVLKDNKTHNTTSHTSYKRYTSDHGLSYFKEDMVIKYGKRGGPKKAVIVSVNRKKRNKNNGYKVTAVDIVKEKIIWFYIESLTEHIKNVKILGKAKNKDITKAKNIYYTNYVDKKQSRSNLYEKVYKEKFNLNTSYRDRKVYIKLKNGRWYRVERTSWKSVYYFDPFTYKVRYVAFKSIRGIYGN